MVTREEVVGAVQEMPEEHLDELYQIIKNFERNNGNEESNQNVMAALRQIKISASPDFSIKADLYEADDSHAR